MDVKVKGSWRTHGFQFANRSALVREYSRSEESMGASRVRNSAAQCGKAGLRKMCFVALSSLSRSGGCVLWWQGRRAASCWSFRW